MCSKTVFQITLLFFSKQKNGRLFTYFPAWQSRTTFLPFLSGTSAPRTSCQYLGANPHLLWHPGPSAHNRPPVFPDNLLLPTITTGKKTSPHPIYMVSYTRLPIQDAACSEIVLLIRCICARDITVITRPIACIAITPTKRNHVTRSQ